MATIDDLPPELLFHVFKYFDGPNYTDIDLAIFAAMKVCRTWEATGYRVLFEVNVDSQAMMRGFWVYLEDHLASLAEKCGKEQKRAKQERELPTLDSRRTPRRQNRAAYGLAQLAPTSQTGPAPFGLVTSQLQPQAQTPSSLQAETTKKKDIPVPTVSRRSQVEEVKRIMRFCGSWNGEPKALQGDLQDIIWSELVLDRIRAQVQQRGEVHDMFCRNTI